MKELLLIALVANGLAFVPVERSETHCRFSITTAGVIRGNRRDPAQSHSNFKEKSRLIFLPNYGCLESLSGQSSMPSGL